MQEALLRPSFLTFKLSFKKIMMLCQIKNRSSVKKKKKRDKIKHLDVFVFCSIMLSAFCLAGRYTTDIEQQHQTWLVT